LSSKTPLQAMKDWHKLKPELFKKQPYYRSGCDTYARGASSEDEARVWDDLARRASPVFIEQDADEGKTPKTRLDWPSDFTDEVLARLLALNATRAAEERASGLVPVEEGDDENLEEADAE